MQFMEISFLICAGTLLGGEKCGLGDVFNAHIKRCTASRGCGRQTAAYLCRASTSGGPFLVCSAVFSWTRDGVPGSHTGT